MALHQKGRGAESPGEEQYFVFLDSEHLGLKVLCQFGLPEERAYTDLGRVRVTVERLDG